MRLNPLERAERGTNFGLILEGFTEWHLCAGLIGRTAITTVAEPSDDVALPALNERCGGEKQGTEAGGKDMT
jgi:hypothetical protein